ncbi:MAG: ABC transporter permease, partial [Candidatus Heimdallarchaeaceae archaeon]
INIPFNHLGVGLLIILLELIQAIGFGLLYGALVFRIKNANAVNNLVQFSTMIICAVFFPFSVFPDWMLWISRFHPFSWVVDSLRSNMIGSEPELISKGIFGLSALNTEILIQLVINIVLLIVGILVFTLTKNKALKDGSLSHY